MLTVKKNYETKKTHDFQVLLYFCENLISNVLSAESQKGVIAVQRCSVENMKCAIAIDFVHR